MADTTIEEAKRCPICKIPGEETARVPAKGMRPGTLAMIVFCRNEACRWFNTNWVIQVNPDGTVPIIDHKKDIDKHYPNLISSQEEVDRIAAALARQQEMEITPGAEVRNPHSR